MKKSIIIAIISMAAMSMNAQTQSVGFGVTGKLNDKPVAPSVQISYEIGDLFALETAASFGVRYAQADKVFSSNGKRDEFHWEGFTCMADLDVYGKLKLNRFQVIAGIGYTFREPTELDNLVPNNGTDFIYTYGYSASGLKAQTGLGFSVFQNSRERLDIKALVNLQPYSESGKKVFKTGSEIALIYYLKTLKQKASVFY